MRAGRRPWPADPLDASPARQRVVAGGQTSACCGMDLRDDRAPQWPRRASRSRKPYALAAVQRDADGGTGYRSHKRAHRRRLPGGSGTRRRGERTRAAYHQRRPGRCCTRTHSRTEPRWRLGSGLAPLGRRGQRSAVGMAGVFLSLRRAPEPLSADRDVDRYIAEEKSVGRCSTTP